MQGTIATPDLMTSTTEALLGVARGRMALDNATAEALVGAARKLRGNSGSRTGAILAA